MLVTGVRDIHRVLHEDHRIVVGVRDARATEALRRRRQHLRRRTIRQRIHLARLAHVPVLTELAGEIAARRAERKHRGAGQEMIQRFLLDRIDAEAARAAVGVEPDLAALHASHEAQTALTLMHLAGARTHVALDAAVVERVEILRRMGLGHFSTPIALCPSDSVHRRPAPPTLYGQRAPDN